MLTFIDAEIFVYIHGGYWIEFHKDYSSYCVKPLYESGIKVIIPGYDLGPKGKYLIKILQKYNIYI